VKGGPHAGQDVGLERLVWWPHFTGAEWELPVDVPGERILIGWKMASAQVDLGPPDAVARLLVKVLCRSADLTFAAALRPPIGASLMPRTWRLNRHFSWTTTSRADEAVDGIFHGEPFTWSQRGQVVVLSPPGVAIPLTEKHLHVASDVTVFEELARDGALGVLLPGVDGQVAGLYVFAASVGQTVRDRMEEATRSAEAQFVLATGDDIRDLLSH
jgi:hypothetical protein